MKILHLDLNVTNLIFMNSFVAIIFFLIIGPAQEVIERGVQLARGFPPRSKWTYGEVFHPAVVPQPPFSLATYFISSLKWLALVWRECKNTNCKAYSLTF